MSGGGTTCGTCGFGGQPHDTVHVRATTRAIPGIHNGGHNTHGGFFFLSNPGLTVAMPIPDDPSLPIMAVIKKEMQGLYIYLPGETSGGGRWRRFVRRIIFLVCTKKSNNDNSNRQQEQHQSQQQQHQRQQ
jgi:hypothetical protein